MLRLTLLTLHWAACACSIVEHRRQVEGWLSDNEFMQHAVRNHKDGGAVLWKPAQYFVFYSEMLDALRASRRTANGGASCAA